MTVPIDFWKSIKDRYPLLYPEAHSRSHKDPLVAKHSAEFLLPFIRLSLAEQVFMDSALRASIPVRPEWNSAHNYQYALAQVGQFEFTTNSAKSPYDAPKDSVYRQQKAKINQYLPQLTMPFVIVDRGAFSQRIYGTVLHCADPNDPSRHKCTHISFPSKDNESWVSRYKIEDLISMYSIVGRHSNQPDIAFPKFKRQDEKEGGDE
jgi:hypothetical protein